MEGCSIRLGRIFCGEGRTGRLDAFRDRESMITEEVSSVVDTKQDLGVMTLPSCISVTFWSSGAVLHGGGRRAVTLFRYEGLLLDRSQRLTDCKLWEGRGQT